MQQIMQSMFRWTQFTEKIYTTVAWLPVQFPVQGTWYIRNISSSGNLLASPCTTDHICIMHKVIDIPIDYPGQSSTSNYIPRKKFFSGTSPLFSIMLKIVHDRNYGNMFHSENMLLNSPKPVPENQLGNLWHFTFMIVIA